MAAGKRRFRGPAGAVFVPAGAVDEVTITRKVESGEWVPVVEQKPDPEKPKRSTRKASEK